MINTDTSTKTVIHFEPTFETWRDQARVLVRRGVSPSSLLWKPDHLAHTANGPTSRRKDLPVRVPTEFIEKARLVSCARDPQRWALMYRLLYRLAHESSALLQNAEDPDAHRFLFLEKAVKREVHRMLAFTHFKTIVVNGEGHLMALARPEHPVLDLVADAFQRRMGSRPWSILTPDNAVHGIDGKLLYGEGLRLSNFFLREGLEKVAGDHVRAWLAIEKAGVASRPASAQNAS